jgi:hypothetical protein
VECGAGDGESLSNTLYIERQLHWKGILIEANHEFFSEILARRRRFLLYPSASATNLTRLKCDKFFTQQMRLLSKIFKVA